MTSTPLILEPDPHARVREELPESPCADMGSDIPCSPDSGDPMESKFWLVLHESGNVPQRKGPWPRTEIKAVLREFMAARPTAYIDVLTLGADGPDVRHGPEVLQVLDGRSMSVGRRHNAQTRAAHADCHAAIAKADGRS